MSKQLNYFLRGLGLAVLVAALGGFAYGLQSTSGTGAPATDCKSFGQPATTSGSLDTASNAPSLVPQGSYTSSPPTILFLGNGGSQKVAPYQFSFSTPSKISDIRWDLNLVNGNNTLGSDQARVKITQPHGDVEAQLCINSSGLQYGSYSGTLYLFGPGIATKQVPITVSIKFSVTWWIILGMLLAALIGLFVKWWTVKLNDATATNEPDLWQFGEWLFTKQFFTIAIAVVGAGYGVFYAKYLNVDTFTRGDCWSLWVSTGTAVAASSLIINAIGAKVKPLAAAPAAQAPGAEGLVAFARGDVVAPPAEAPKTKIW
jgi:hypothetical protein